MKKIFTLFLLLASSSIIYAGGGGGLPCGTNVWSGNTGNGTGSDPTSAANGGPCCYAASDLDGDGIQDVDFSVENIQHFTYTIPGDPTDCGQSVDVTVNTTDNLQGATFNTDQTGGNYDWGDPTSDIYTSSFMGSGSFTMTSTGCGGDVIDIYVDGYAGTTGSFSLDISCPPTCTDPTSISAGTDEDICEGESVTLGGSFSGGTVDVGTYEEWSDGTLGGSNTVSPTSTTTYTYTACNTADGSDCCVTDNVTVNVTPVFVPDAGADATICVGATVELGGAPTGPAGSTYSWSCSGDCSRFSFNDGPSGGVSPDNPEVTADGGGAANGHTATYTVTVTNGACSITDAVVVTIGNPVADAGADLSTCAGTDITIGGAPTGAGGSSYSWSAVAGLTGDVSFNDASLGNPTVIVDPTSAGGTVTLEVEVTTGSCSPVTDQMILTIDPLPATPTASASPDPSCGGDNVTLSITSGTAGLTFEWFDAASGGNSLGTGSSIVVTPATTTTYYVEAIDATTFCVGPRGSVVANVTTTSVATAGTDASICLGEDFNLNGSVTNVECTPHVWSSSPAGSFGDANALSTTFTPSAAGTYTLTLTPCSSGSCPPVAGNLTLTVNEAPTVVASSSDLTICTNLITDLNSVTTGGTPNPPIVSTTNYTSTPVSVAIPDGKSGGSPCATTSATTTMSVSGAPSTVDSAAGISIEVCVSTTHTRNTDLQIEICSPGGAHCETVTGTTGNCFDILSAAGMENFEGVAINGTWTITVTDCRRKKTGNLTGFSIDVNEETYANSYTTVWTPNTGVFDDSASVTQWSSPGPSPTTEQKIVTSTDNNGCTGSDTLDFQIDDCFCNLDTLRIANAVALLDTPSGSFTQYKVFFSEPAQCSTIQNADFELFGTDLGSHTIASVDPISCSGTPSATDSILVTLNEPVYDVAPDVHIRTSGVADILDTYTKCPILINGGSNLFSPLSVENIYLKGVKEENKIKLTWNILSDIEVEKFDVFKSADGVKFVKIADVNKKDLSSFELYDESPYLGKNYYKIKAVSKNSKFSNTVSVTVDKTQRLHVIPNPISNTSNLMFYSNNSDKATLNVYDVKGKLVRSELIETVQGKNNLEFDFSELSNGSYTLILKNNSFTLEERIIKQ